jgi:hypothetical protein
MIEKFFKCISLFLCTLTIITSIHCALAEYKYNTEDPRLAQERLVQDIQSGTVDFTALGPPARDKILQNLYGMYSMVMRLGALKEVCPTLIVAFPHGKRLAFRTNHVNGKADWVLWVSSNPQVVEDFVLLDVPSGPPAILPPVEPGSRLLPSVEIDCENPQSVEAPPQELIDACHKWPRMC